MKISTLISDLRRRYPTRNWLGQCERLIWNVVWITSGVAESKMRSFPTARASFNSSDIVTNSLDEARVGDIVWFDYPGAGHNGVVVSVGPVRMLHASTQGDTISNYGQGLKISTVSSYPYKRMGFSRSHDGNPAVKIEIPKPSPKPKPKPANWAFNPPSKAVQKRIQQGLKKRGRYSGPVDGIWGVNSRKGIQITARAGGGYTGPIDGVPGRQTCLAIQRYAKRWGGYKGPIDGILGPKTWEGFAKGVA